jgi:GDPmannose 4,6-dehydratase
VHGIIRRTSTFNTDRIDHIYQDSHIAGAKLFLHYGDLADGVTLRRLLELVQPHEIYNLGAQSHVRVSFDAPEYTVDIVAMGALRLLEAIRDYEQRTKLQVRYYQAGSSEMYGLVQEVPQSETTPFYPRSPYACGKLFAHWQTIDARLENPLLCEGRRSANGGVPVRAGWVDFRIPSTKLVNPKLTQKLTIPTTHSSNVSKNNVNLPI